jgi:autotransporter-associated beta strand protein
MAVGAVLMPALRADAQSVWTTTTTGTTNWSAATWTGGAPVSGTSTVVSFFPTSPVTTLASGVAIVAPADISPNPFILNQLNINGSGPASGTGPTLTLQGNGLQFDGTSPQLNVNGAYGAGPGYTININNALIFNTATAINFSSGGAFINTGGAWNGASNVTFTGALTNRPLSLPVAAGTFTGDLTLAGSTSVLQLNALNAALGANASTTQSVIVNSGSGVNINNGNGAYTNAQNFVLNGNGNGNTSSAALNANGLGFGNGVVGGLALASDSTVRVAVNTAGESRGVTLTRGLVGTGKLTKTGPGYLFLPSTLPTYPVTWGGTAYSAFTGDIDINGGVVQTSTISNSLGSNTAGTQKVTIAAGAAMVVGANNNSWTNPQNFVLNGSGTGIALNAGGVNALQSAGVGFGSNVIRSLILASDASVGATRQNAAGNRGLSVSAGLAGGGTLSISNNFGVNYGALFVDVASPAAGITVTGSTTYAQFSGRVVINNGALEINNANSLGATSISAGQVYLSGQGVFSSGITGGLDQTFIGRISNAATSAGTVALNVASANSLNFTAAPNLYLGTTAGVTYSGTLTPGANGYLLGGGGATLTVSSNLTGATTPLTVAGGVTLTGTANTFAGGITIAGMNTGADYATQLNFTGGGTAVLPSNDVTFSRNGGTFAYTGATTGSSQSMGALTFSAGAGNVSSIWGTSGNTSLTFSSLATRTAGASGNFIVTNGANGTTNKIVLTGASAGFMDRGLFFGGSNYAFYDATGYVRAPVYGTDSGFVTSAGGASIASASHQQITGALTAQNTASFDTLRVGGAFNVTLAASQTLSLDGLLKAGANGLTISGGTGVQTKTAGAELVVRSDSSGDTVTISTSILDNGTSSLTKTGAGSLTLSAASNTYAGGTIITQGTLSVSGGGLPNTGAVRVAGGTYSLAANDTIGALTLRNGSITYSVASNTAVTPWTLTGTSYAVENGQVNVILGGSGVTFTKSTAGNVTLTANNTYTGDTTIQAGKLTLVNAAVAYPLGSSNIIVGNSSLNSSATLDVLGVSQGFTVPANKTLSGHGIVYGNVTFANLATLAPGSSTGILTMNGDVKFASGSTYFVEVTGTSATPIAGNNNDQLIVNGTVDVTGSNLTLSLAGFAPTTSGGETFFLIRNDGSDAVTGTFAGLADGTTFTSGGYNFTISYFANAEGTPAFTGGNDVAVQVVPIPEPTTLFGAAGLIAALARRRSGR